MWVTEIVDAYATSVDLKNINEFYDFGELKSEIFL